MSRGATTSITINLDDGTVREMLNGLISRADNPSSVMAKVAQLMVESVRRNFAAGGRRAAPGHEGRIVLRQRAIKMIQTTKDLGLIIVLQTVGGRLEAWTMVPSPDPKYVNKQRVEMLLWPKGQDGTG